MLCGQFSTASQPEEQPLEETQKMLSKTT